MQSAWLDESQAWIKIARRNINNLRYADDTTLVTESEEKPKNILMRVKEESEKPGLKFNIQKTKTMAPGPITSWQTDGEKSGNSDRLFLGLQNHWRWWLQSWNWKILVPWEETCNKSTQSIKRQRNHFANKGPYSQSHVFSSSHVRMSELDHKEGWSPKNWCLWIVVLKKTLESPLDCKEIQPVHPKGDQPWVLIGSTDVEAETPILWPPHAKSWLIRKVPDAGRDWGQEEKGTTEDKIAGWHHRLDGHEFE